MSQKIIGIVLHLGDDGCLSMLEYVGDRILFIEHDLLKACNKLLLCVFEQVSRVLKINLEKRVEQLWRYQR
jgi:hypothetical protein